MFQSAYNMTLGGWFMIKENIKYCDSCVFEGMTSISALIGAIESGNNDRKIQKIYFDKEKTKSKARELGFLRAKSFVHNFEIEFVSAGKLSSFTVGSTHGGIVALCSDRSFFPLSEEKITKNGIYFYIEGIEDPYNFGNSIRSLYALGVDGLVVGERNWFSSAGIVARSSAGTSELLNVYTSFDICNAIDLFRAQGYKIICAGIRDSVSIFEADLSAPVFIILGGEKRGISRKILDMADTIVRIDYGNKFSGSLSSSASCAIFAYEALRGKKV